MKRWIALLSLLGIGCIDSREPPERLPQAVISYGPRIILVDDTRVGAPNSAWCTRLTTVATGTTPAGVMAVDGKSTLFDPANVAPDAATPTNCFIQVRPKELQVDQVEVTNELFQLCIDSGACERPDPSKAGKGPICNDEDRFDVCPLVEVTQSQASRFCSWVGRRLPTGIESIAIRQANIPNKSDPIAVANFVYPTGTVPPRSCEEAVIKAHSCLKPRPVTLGDPIRGAAAMDTVTGQENTPIFDLMGNVSEWTADLQPISRGPGGEDLPWFCVAALSDQPFSETNPPVCPATAKCVHGQYRPYETAEYGIWPVCIIGDNATFSGTRGSLFGGSYRDESTTRDVLGTFGRRVENEPEGLPDTQRAREYGFRCVGQRASALPGGNPPEFDDFVEVLDVSP